MQNNSPLSLLIHTQAVRYSNRAALLFRDGQKAEWRTVSWADFSFQVKRVSAALLALGVEENENIAIFAPNMVQGLFTDFGAYAIRAVTVPIYSTSSEMQLKYIVSDAKIRYIFVGEQYQYNTALCVLRQNSHLTKIIIYDNAVKRDPQDTVSLYFDHFLAEADIARHSPEIETRTAQATPGDTANILYTSGTTGLSKGVIITHQMFAAAVGAFEHAVPLSEQDVVLSYLPFTHIMERAWSYLCLAKGCTLAVNQHPHDILQSMREVHPTAMCAVPRFWEKVYDAVQEKIHTASPAQRKVILEAIEVGKEYNLQYRMRGIVPPERLRAKYQRYQNTVYPYLLKQLGLERQNCFPTAGAAIPQAVEEFIHAVGIPILIGYGLTESTATVSIDRWNKRTSIGSVGRLLDGVQIKFGAQNEVLLKGNMITPGYYRKAEVTELAFDQDGWFHTGDAGYLKNGELYLTDRIKDLFKTSNGKYIAPQMIESKLVVDRYIDQIVAVADQRKFVSALVIPNYKLLEDWAQEQNVAFDSRASLCANEEVTHFVMERIHTLQQEFAHYEQVKRITLLPEPFSLQKGELTDTLKIKRAVLNVNYAAQIEKMYQE